MKQALKNEMMTTKSNIPNIVYEVPGDVWTDGLPIGNGETGALVYDSNKGTCWGMSKADIWDTRQTRFFDLTPHREIMRVLKNKDWAAMEAIRAKERHPWGAHAHPCPKPAGVVQLAFEGWRFKRKTLTMQTGECVVEGQVRGIPCTITSWVEPGQNLLVIDIYVPGRSVLTGELSITRQTDDLIGRAPMPWKSGARAGGVNYALRENFAYTLAGLGCRGSVTAIADPPQLALWCGSAGVVFPFRISGQARFLIALETGRSAAQAQRRALNSLSRSTRTLTPQIHRKHWADFWATSSFYLDDGFLHRAAHFWLYQWACTSGGSVAPGLHGLWNQLATPPWHGSYTDLNQTAMSRPGTRANHPRLERAFLRTFYKMLPMVRRETHKAFGLDGARYPHQGGPDGRELGYTHMRYGMAAGGLYALLFWDHYRLTGDRAFLRKMAWPVMWACLKFYIGYLRKTKNGQLEAWPSYSLEQGPGFVRNIAFDLAVIRDLAEACSTAAHGLGLGDRAKLIERWRQRLPKFPMQNGAIADSEDAIRVPYIVRHAGPAGVFFPCNGLGEMPGAEKIAAKTFAAMRRATDLTYATFAWGWLACFAARIGRGRTVLKLLRENVFSTALKFNGFIAQVPCGYNSMPLACFADQTVREWMPERNANSLIFMEAPALCLSALQESLLQDHGGLVRLFPAAQGMKKAAFHRWRVEGGFLLSACWQNGGPGPVVRLESTIGGKLRISNPWPAKQVYLVRGKAGRAEPILAKHGALQIDLAKNQVGWLVRDEKNLINPVFQLPTHPAKLMSGPTATRVYQPLVKGRRVVWLGRPRD